MLKILFSVLLLPRHSRQHLMPEGSHYHRPENVDFKRPSCSQSFTCLHSGVMVCGTDYSTSDKKWFIDECDMHEFNCDFLKDFVKIANIECEHVPPIFDFELETGDWRDKPSQPLDVATINDVETVNPNEYHSNHLLSTTTLSGTGTTIRDNTGQTQAALNRTEGHNSRKDIIALADFVENTEVLLSNEKPTEQQSVSDAMNISTTIQTDNLQDHTFADGTVNQTETIVLETTQDHTFADGTVNQTEPTLFNGTVNQTETTLLDGTVNQTESTLLDGTVNQTETTLLDSLPDNTFGAELGSYTETTSIDILNTSLPTIENYTEITLPDNLTDQTIAEDIITNTNISETILSDNQTDQTVAVDIGTSLEILVTETTTAVMSTSNTDIMSSTSNETVVLGSAFFNAPFMQELKEEIPEVTTKNQDDITMPQKIINNNEEFPRNTIHITCIPYSPQNIVDTKKLPVAMSYSSGTSTVVTCPTILSVQMVNSSTIIVTCLQNNVEI